ncbi:MAG: DEAD/DEAH box helicase [archaeon]
MLPILDILSRNPERRISCLYITPLKALNRNLFERIIEIGNDLGIDIDIRHGDTPTNQRTLQTKDPPNVLITTPESLQAIIIGKKIKEHLKNVDFVIIDEIHEIIGEKRGEQLLICLERLKNQLGRDFVRIGLSATISNPKTVAEILKGSNESEVLIIESKDQKKTEISVVWPEEEVQDTEEPEEKDWFYSKINFIARRVKENAGVLVFVNTRDSAEILGSKLKAISSKFGIHHSSLSKESRLKTEKELKNKDLVAVVATSSLALGIDIGHIDLVIQYMSPRRVDSLVQRIGRAGHRLSEISRGEIVVIDEDDALEAAVIAKLALSKRLEPMEFIENSFDVVANQLTGIGFEGCYSVENAFATIKRAVPFKNLPWEEFTEILNLLINLRILRILENGVISIKKPAFSFFFSNLSMIKDSRKFDVIKFESKEKIAQIDEEFSSELELGASFICRGAYWKVISKEGNKVFVEETSVAYNVPEWSGELMPVDYSIAIEVNCLRSGWPSKKTDYLKIIDANCAKKIENDLKLCGNFQETILGVECGENFVVIRSFFGNKVNETLGRLLSAYFSLKYGDSIGLRTDAYRIFIKFPGTYSKESIKETILSIKEDKIGQTLRTIVRNSPQFKQRFIQIAKKFGVVSKDAVFSKMSIQRLVDVYSETPVFEETINEHFFEKLDIEKTRELVKRIKSGVLKIEILGAPTPFSMRFIERYSPELVFSGLPAGKVREMVKKRLERKKFQLACLNCKKGLGIFTAKSIDFACPICNSKLLGILKRENLPILSAKGPLSKADASILEKSKRTANLYLSYGQKTFLVLAGYGIGPETAARVLAKSALRDYTELISEILKAEKTFARTRIYWNNADSK